MTARILRGCVLLTPLALVVALVPPVAARTQAATTKSVFVTVVDANGKPVKDLPANEFRVTEDNAIREIVEIKPAKAPLYVALLGDTTRTAIDFVTDIRQSLVAFIKQVHGTNPEAQISLQEFGQASMTIVPYTTKTADLEKAAGRIMPKANAPSVLLEALMETTKTLQKKPSPRRAIVVLNMEPGEESSREQPNAIMTELRKSSASLWSVSLQKGQLKNEARGLVLDGLVKNSGGHREFIVGQSAIMEILKNYADCLNAQYEITYKRPASTKAETMLVITRPALGYKVYGGLFAPQ